MKPSQIDTRQGTASVMQYSNGNTLPITNVPFGMNSYAVQTRTPGNWYFHPEDRTIHGIRVTHQPSPWIGDFGHFLLMPVTGRFFGQSAETWASSYRPEKARFHPHHLKLELNRYEVVVELAPSERGANLRIDYPGNAAAALVISGFAPGSIRITADGRRVSGFMKAFTSCEDPDFGIWYVLELDHPLQLDGCSLVKDNTHSSLQIDVLQEYENIPIYLPFEAEAGTVQVRLATSFISEEQALANLQVVPDCFRNALKDAEAQWEEVLNRIEIEGDNPKQIRTFYTCLYRMFCFPQKFYEIDKDSSPIHYDTTARAVKPGILYTNNGFWDTYKTVYPFYSLLVPDDYAEMLEGFLNSYRETGFLPKWLSPDERGCMPGTLVDAVIADAVSKGIAPHLWEDLLEGMLAGATKTSKKPGYGRSGTAAYLKYGYVPCDDYHESVNHTQDYAYSDYCISVVADALGKTDLAAQYRKSSLNYRNLFDKEHGLMRPRKIDGSFYPETFDPFLWGGHYTEGSAWQNSFAVFHDFAGLIKEYGSVEAFEAQLTTLCNTPPDFHIGGYHYEIHEMSEMAAVDFGQLAISNQPSFHLPYLFTYAGRPSTTQVLVRQLLTQLFHSGFNGFPGDEDNGSMAGWFVLNSMGFYPVCPGSSQYVIGIPLFDKVTLHLPNGKTLVISARNNAPQTQFVNAVERNGKPYDKLYFEHTDLMAGGEICFHLGVAPVQKQYTGDQLPFSVTR